MLSERQYDVYTPERWRLEQLLRTGMAWESAAVLAASTADLHQMLKLLSDGATPEQVQRLML